MGREGCGTPSLACHGGLLLVVVATLPLRCIAAAAQLTVHAALSWLLGVEAASTAVLARQAGPRWPRVARLATWTARLGALARRRAFLAPWSLGTGRPPSKHSRASRRALAVAKAKMAHRLPLDGLGGPWLEPFYSFSQVDWLLSQRPLQYVVVPQLPSLIDTVLE